MHRPHGGLASAILILALGPAPHAARHGVAAGRNEQRAIANDNRTPAGAYRGDTLALHLVAGPADWHILGDSEPAFSVLAFGEEGKQPMIPGPLIRVKVGTPIHVTVRNAVGDTLIVRGLQDPDGARDSVVVLSGEVGEARFVASHQGSYFYWGATAAATRKSPRGAEVRSGIPIRPFGDSQLSAALVVDPPGTVADDRILVITGL